ncbi:MAG: AI-2E family transporter [Planctomycetes bacterium]|nr:AI-2E family transporter [Planctomycetota bacterium]
MGKKKPKHRPSGAERSEGDAPRPPAPTSAPTANQDRPWQHLKTPGFWILIALFAVVLIAAILVFLPFWGTVLAAAIFTSLLYPLYRWVLRWVGERRRGTASIITCVLFVVAIVGPILGLGFAIASEATTAVPSIAKRLGEAIDKWCERPPLSETLARHPEIERQIRWVRRSLDKLAPPEEEPSPPAAEPEPSPVASEPAPESASPGSAPFEDGVPLSPEGLVQMLGGLTKLTTGILAGAAGLTLKVCLFFFLMFFFFRDGPQILDSLRKGIPVAEEYQEKVIRNFQEVVRSMIRGTLLTALFQGTLAGIAYACLGLQAFFWGAVTGICALVPIAGTGLVTVPITAMFLLNEQWASAAVMAVVAAIVATLDNFVRPLLVQGGLRLHPVWILLALLGGVGAFGVIGIVLGPMVVVLLRTLLSLLVDEETRGPIGVRRSAARS